MNTNGLEKKISKEEYEEILDETIKDAEDNLEIATLRYDEIMETKNTYELKLKDGHEMIYVIYQKKARYRTK